MSWKRKEFNQISIQDEKTLLAFLKIITNCTIDRET